MPTDVAAHLDESVDGVRTAHPELRWVKASRWHLTCEFLGECTAHETDRQLARWERRALRSSPLPLRLEAAGTFPKAWMARVLWMGVAGDLQGWKKLAAYEQEPHMTLARTRDRQDLTGLVDELGRYVGPPWVATEVSLIQSFLPGGRGGGRGGPSSGPKGDRGPRYDPLATFPLGAVGPDP